VVKIITFLELKQKMTFFKGLIQNEMLVIQLHWLSYQCPSRNGRFWFPARPERVINRSHSALFRGL